MGLASLSNCKFGEDGKLIPEHAQHRLHAGSCIRGFCAIGLLSSPLRTACRLLCHGFFSRGRKEKKAHVEFLGEYTRP